MSLELSPKLLDFIEFSDGTAEGKRRGTIVDMIGEEALVEVSDEQGVPSGFFVRAVHDLARVVGVAPTPQNIPRSEGQVYFENGVLLIQNGLVDLAKEDFRRAFSIDPKFRGTLLHLVNNLGAQGAFDAAIVLYKLLLDVSPDYSFARENLAITYLNRGAVQGKEGKLIASLEDFNRALTLNPSGHTVSQILHNLVASYTQLGVVESDAMHYERAYRFFQVAFELDQSATSRQNLAVALIAMATERSGNNASRRLDQIFDQPRLMGLSLSACWTAYGATVAQAGNENEARRAFLQALDADPGNSIAKHNLEVLSMQRPNERMASGLIPREIESVPLTVAG
jgi:tetratricopeptide (TPR) repeat protein